MSLQIKILFNKRKFNLQMRKMRKMLEIKTASESETETEMELEIRKPPLPLPLPLPLSLFQFQTLHGQSKQLVS